MKIERSKLNSKQKLKIFQQYFGEILLKEGFVYRENYFVRVHPGECVLLVGLEIERRNCYVVFDAIPFCCKEHINNPAIGYRVDSFQKISNFAFEEYYLKAFENGRFELQLELFKSFIKERFLQIQSVAQLLAFENEVLFPVMQDAGRWYSKMLECMQLQEYNGARTYIHKLRDHEKSCLKTEEDALNFKLQWLETTKEKELSEAFFLEYTKKCEEILNLCDFWEQMIIHNDYDRILDLINSRIAESNNLCRERWIEFYK